MNLLPAAAIPFIFAVSASAQYAADFDGLAEGTADLTIVTGGLTFTDFDRRTPGTPPPAYLVIEDASQTLAGQAGFTAPNTLASGHSPGPTAAFSRFGSMRIIPDSEGTIATVHIYEYLTTVVAGPGNSVVLAAYSNGVEIDRVSAPLAGGFAIHHYELFLEASDPFDELRLMGEGPADLGVFFGVVDSVSVVGELPHCYANCDESTTSPVLNVADFTCFLQRFAAGDPEANCDESTVPPVLNVADFSCFLQRFAAGCP